MGEMCTKSPKHAIVIIKYDTTHHCDQS